MKVSNVVAAMLFTLFSVGLPVLAVMAFLRGGLVVGGCLLMVAVAGWLTVAPLFTENAEGLYKKGQ